MCNANYHDPGCRCGFGGDGHLGKSYGGPVRPGALSDRWGDYCGVANCHYCGSRVYFVRHNGGSVWFDSLGAPWPRHECYYLQRDFLQDEIRVHKQIFEWIRGRKNAQSGVVVETEAVRGEGEAAGVKGLNVTPPETKIITVRRIDQSEIKLKVEASFDVSNFQDQFVIFSLKKGELIRPYIYISTIFSVSKTLTEPQETKLPELTRPIPSLTESDVPKALYLQRPKLNFARCDLCGVLINTTHGGELRNMKSHWAQVHQRKLG